ncbi:hypothetical protein GP486_001140 [Trichoglossum hirsutum]|uniref:Uncharacterized protein n=1 Tax=Trichoglossum hirsutum TaxID=265104 RepID=A0A9P8LHP7_9PEZI|nr:hypothetical protein GP486_001140 [Trichoglossum hirsutum]
MSSSPYAIPDSSERPSRNYRGLRITSDPPLSAGPGNPLLSHTPSSDPNQNASTPSETDLLASGYASKRDRDGAPLGCRSRKPVRTRGRRSRALVLVLSIYSTLLSGAFFVIAILGPVYDKTLGVGGVISPSTAQIASTIIARTIELSFVTVFVAFVGQVLVAEAFVERDARQPTKGKRGITMGEMAMRTWISEPGTIVSEWRHVRHAGLSLLGMLCLTATIMATLYTAAANALGNPCAHPTEWMLVLMSGGSLAQASE